MLNNSNNDKTGIKDSNLVFLAQADIAAFIRE